MLAKIRAMLAPLTFGDDKEKNRLARIIHVILLAGCFVIVPVIFLIRPQSSAENFIQFALLLLLLVLVGLLWVLRRGHIQFTSYALVTFTWLALAYLAAVNDGIRDTVFLFLIISILIASLLLGWRVAIVLIAITVVTGWGFVIAENAGYILPDADTPEDVARDLTSMFILMAVLIYLIISNLQTSLTETRQSNKELEALSLDLERRVQERTSALETSTEISRRLSTILDTKKLLQEVVNQIQQAFHYYHVHIYLLNDDQEALIMAGGTGEAGGAMLAAGHQLMPGQGLVGRAAETNTVVLVPDVSQDEQWLPNPLLPNTAAEVAIPIAISNQVLGVLDVQHDQTGVLNNDSIALLESISSQVAIALQNARQVEITESALDEVNKSQQRFTLAVDGSNDGIWDWDIPTNEVYFSPRWKEMIGYADHEIANEFDEYESQLHPDDHDRMMQAISDYLEGKVNTFEHESRLQHKDGSYRWILVRATLVRNEDGVPLRMAGSHSDITARKESEQQLQEAQNRTQTILESIIVPIVISGVTDGIVLYVNDPLTETIRSPREALLGEVTPDFYANPDDRAPFLAAIRQDGFVNNYELLLKRADGETFWAIVSARIINYQGAPALLTSLIDISDRKEAEQQIQEEQERIQAILESINVPLVISKIADGVVMYVNEPLAAMIGESPEALIGEVTPDFYQDPADRQAYLAELREQGYVDNFDTGLKRIDGDPFWALLSGRVFNFQGERAIVTSLIDITERREAQAALAQRAGELETVAEVGTIAATILEPEGLLQQVVDLTKNRFDLYHAHVYLLDAEEGRLRLSHGAGDIGKTMVAEGRQISLAQEQSLVARSARIRQGVIINDVQAEPGFLPHPLLPDTHAEMAVPLIAGDLIMGVLDVQSTEVDRFTTEDVNIFTTLASQVAVALQNARRYDETAARSGRIEPAAAGHDPRRVGSLFVSQRTAVPWLLFRSPGCQPHHANYARHIKLTCQ